MARVEWTSHSSAAALVRGQKAEGRPHQPPPMLPLCAKHRREEDQQHKTVSRDRQECVKVLGGPHRWMREKGSVCKDSPRHPTPMPSFDPGCEKHSRRPDATDEWKARSRSPLRRPCDMHDLANQNPTRRRRRPSDQSAAADSNGGVCLWYLRHAIRLGLDICTIGVDALCVRALCTRRWIYRENVRCQ